MAVVDQDRADVGGDAEQAGMTERDQACIAHQHVQAECEYRVDQHLGGDVDVVAVADPERQRREHNQRDEQRETLQTTHPVCAPHFPLRPWGRRGSG